MASCVGSSSHASSSEMAMVRDFCVAIVVGARVAKCCPSAGSGAFLGVPSVTFLRVPPVEKEGNPTLK